MRKNKLILIITAACFSMLAGCTSTQGAGSTTDNTQEGASDSGPAYLEDINVDEYVTLGEYKGVAVALPSAEVTDEDLEIDISTILLGNIMPIETDEAVKEGYQVNIDYEGKRDGVAFEGGTAAGASIVVGSGSYIADLEQGMIGMKKGEVKDIPVTFPEGYQNAELAGQEAVFTVTMNSISIVPESQELTDEFVVWYTGGVQSTVEEFRIAEKEFLIAEAQDNQDAEKSTQVADIVVANAEFKGLPEGFVARIESAISSNIAYYASMFGMETADYLMATGMMAQGQTEESVIKEQAEATVKQYLVFQAIANKENLSVSDSELDEDIVSMAEGAGVTVEEYEANIDRLAYREYMMLEKVLAFLGENATVTIQE